MIPEFDFRDLYPLLLGIGVLGGIAGLVISRMLEERFRFGDSMQAFFVMLVMVSAGAMGSGMGMAMAAGLPDRLDQYCSDLRNSAGTDYTLMTARDEIMIERWCGRSTVQEIRLVLKP